MSGSGRTPGVSELVADRVETGAEVTPGARLVEDLGLDSLARAELWVAVEDAFDCRIPDRDAERLTSVEGIVSYLRERGIDARA